MMEPREYKEADRRYYMPVFSREIQLVRGEGARVWDDTGMEYIDCVAGIAVCSTGHCHPEVVKAICDQSHRLIHCSNLYYVPHQAELVERLAGVSGLSRAFLCNSGTEATEAAVKLARVITGRKTFIAFTHGFHGRTMGALAVTHKPAIREPFEPLEPRCAFLEFGDAEAVKATITRETAGVIVEPIQGEAGVIVPPEGFLSTIRDCCDDTGALMIVDEVQTGMGRTGRWLAIQHAGIEPDVVTLAKGMASGFPIGALLAREPFQFKKGEHGSTFGGGPVACAAALATLRVIDRILPKIPGKGERFRSALARHSPRGIGLMLGISVGDRCSSVQQQCRDQGVLVNCAADGNLRLVPPLVITEEEIDRAAEVIDAALG
jgi:acetylornithine/N-succinyldiaminopimelate aminotransferase